MAVISHSSLSLISMIFLSGSIVLLMFVVLSGVTTTIPLNNTYFLRAGTAGISGARPISQWTYFFVCGDDNKNCGDPVPALPVGFAWSGNPSSPPPKELVGDYGSGTTSFAYWYMWRFGWVFYIMALFVEVMAWFTGFLACCGRLGSAISGLVTLFALVLYTAGVSLMTATFVKMRNAFLADGRTAEIGVYAFGFSWGAWAALLISVALFCVGTRSGKGESRHRRRKSTRSRRSYEVGSKRVKEEYA